MLRSATSLDFETIYQIYMSPSVNPFMSWDVIAAEEFRPIFDGIMAMGFLYVYEEEGQVIGVIRLDRKKYRSSHVAYVGGLGVQKNFQGKGYGAKIMKEALEKLARDGVKRIELLVESDNAKAIALYGKLGFVREGTLRKCLKRSGEIGYIDDYLMALVLD